MSSASPQGANSPQPIFDFASGLTHSEPIERDILGGKGAGLAEMGQLGVPVPPGFTISTSICRYYHESPDEYPGLLSAAVDQALTRLEERVERCFGDEKAPLLVSVRSGATVSMPGMMDTVLNVGLNDRSVVALGNAGGERFALDCYRRLIEMYGDVVAGIDPGKFSATLAEAKQIEGADLDHELSVAGLHGVIDAYKRSYETSTGTFFPQDPREQLWGAIDAVFASWNSARAVTYRRIRGISAELGTAVNIQAMVFGNLGPDSATGVCFTRDPGSGAPTFFGEYLPNAQGEDVVAGIRTPRPIRSAETADGDPPSFEEAFPNCYRELLEVRDLLEKHFGDMQEIEFTVQDRKLFLLQTRSGQRTGAAALRIACDLYEEGLVDKAQALQLVDAESVTQVLAPAFSPQQREAAESQVIGHGLAASPGAACGAIAFSADDAVAMHRRGVRDILLVREETSPEDIAGMEVATGIVTTRGGKTSHAAVVARGMGKPCVVGSTGISIDETAGEMTAGELVLREGAAIAIDGSAGVIYRGELSVVEPEILQALNGKLEKDESALFGHFSMLMEWADERRQLGVRANADTPEDAAIARQLGARGIGLCRTEHMFFGSDRLLAFRRMILAASDEGRYAALEELRPYQKEDFLGIFRTMDGLPVTIRLLDPPLHEFLPHGDAEIEAFAREAELSVEAVRKRINETREINPMLGLRGCRLALTHPEIAIMQIRAIFEAAFEAMKEGVEAIPEIMIPLVSTVTEVRRLREIFEETIERVATEQDGDLENIPYLFGTMIEIPRAALQAKQIAEHVDFFSFGTNDLTQMTYGLSRDDTAAMIHHYLEQGLLTEDPFTSLDQQGVGDLMRIACERGRKGNLKLGICGEHGGDARSVVFCHGLGLEYVSCSPYRVPVARLAAAQAVLG